MTRILLALLLFAGCNPTPRPAPTAVPSAPAAGVSPVSARSGQPDDHPGAQPASPGWRPVPGRITPSSSADTSAPSVAPTGTRPALTTKPRTAQHREPDAILRGTATWFRSPSGVSAAGPDLRSALGPDWRGTRVRVTGPAGSILVVLGDWMRADRLIDLDDGQFVRVCGPLWRGICWATVTR